MKILFVCYPSLGLNEGGLQIQIRETKRHLERLGVTVDLYNPWQCDLSGYDAIHVFSLAAACRPFVEAAAIQGIPVVISPVFNAYYRNWRILRAQVRLGGLLRGYASYLHEAQKMLALATRVIALSREEVDMLQRVFDFQPEGIAIIGNGIHESAGTIDAKPFLQEFDLKNFVLCVGKIERRKNQLSLIRACKALSLPLVLIGSPNATEPDYYQQCREEADDSMLFLGHLSNDAPLLWSAYAAADIFALVSHSEVLPLSVLEAAASGCKLLVTTKSAIKNLLPEGEGVRFVAPDEEEIKKMLAVIKSDRPQPDLKQIVQEKYTWQAVAADIYRTYQALAPARNSAQ